jgi:hypothetical protein
VETTSSQLPDLHFADVTGRAHVVRVVTADGHDWHLHATIDGRTFSKHCHDWQSVERMLTWLRHHSHEPLEIDTSAPKRGHGLMTLLAAALTLAVSVAAFAQPAAEVSPAVAAFTAATNDYARMHRRLERQLPPLVINADPETIRHAVEAMANAIRVARSDAKQGDFFTPELATELRTRVDAALRAQGLSANDIRHAEVDEGIDSSTVRLGVNGAFPWIAGCAMFPCVIGALPALPPELQYRIVGNTLVLIDVHASLIVDLLPNLLIDSTLKDEPRGIFPPAAKIPRLR